MCCCRPTLLQLTDPPPKTSIDKRRRIYGLLWSMLATLWVLCLFPFCWIIFWDLADTSLDLLWIYRPRSSGHRDDRWFDPQDTSLHATHPWQYFVKMWELGYFNIPLDRSPKPIPLILYLQIQCATNCHHEWMHEQKVDTMVRAQHKSKEWMIGSSEWMKELRAKEQEWHGWN